MEIVSKAGVELLKINVSGASQHLNPFLINIDKIRYFREYKGHGESEGWCAVIGDKKLFHSLDLNFDHVEPGKSYKIGGVDFECVISVSIDGLKKYKTLVNNKRLLYMRKFVTSQKSNVENNKNDIVYYENLDTFAIIWADERIMPVLSPIK